MRKIQSAAAAILLLTGILLAGCFGSGSRRPASGTESGAKGTETEAAAEKAGLPDGVYTAEFHTDSSMFRVNEAYDGKGTLTAEDGAMTIHVSLVSKNIVNLYPGSAEDAQKEGAKLLLPTEDTVSYSDGWTEEVYGFDIPVPALDEEFDLALLGAKGKWYDHKVSVSDPEPLQEQTASGVSCLEDGDYTMELTLEGGSGRAAVSSPAAVSVSEGAATAVIEWSSPDYDYMIVGGQKYLPVNTEGNSVFELPVSVFDEPIPVIGDTTAMSRPHEVEYTLTFHSDTVRPAQ